MSPVDSLPGKYRQPRVRLIADLPADDAERTALVIELRLAALELRRTAASMDQLIALLTKPTPAPPRVVPAFKEGRV